MLAHFEHFNLPSLLKDLDWLHVRLFDRLDCHLVAELLVFGKFDNAELTLAKVILQIVKLIDVELTNDLPNGFQPLCLTVDRAKVQDPRLIRRQHDLDWVQIASSIRVDLWLRLLDECSRKTVHDPLIIIALISEAKQIFADHLSPMLFKSVSSRFQEALAFQFKLMFKLNLVLTEIINNHILNNQIVALVQHHEW